MLLNETRLVSYFPILPDPFVLLDMIFPSFYACLTLHQKRIGEIISGFCRRPSQEDIRQH